MASLLLTLLLTWAGSTAAQGPTPEAAFTPLPEPTEQSAIDEAALRTVDLKAIPILPDFATNAAFVRGVLAEGKNQAVNPDVFSKVGDCMTATPNYLIPFAQPGYKLAQYESLEAVIERFSRVKIREELTAFSNPSLAAASGFNAAAVLDATWSDPQWCGVEESPLACEYRHSRPVVAFILFGTNDLRSLTLPQFDYYLRRVVVETANRGVLPILSTFPNQPGLVEKSILYNQLVARVANEYQAPLINLWRAFEPLPNQGIDPAEPTHMTKPASGEVASFAEADLQGGYNLHNLLTLQTLERLIAFMEKEK